MRLYHYSNKDIKKLKVNFYGTNDYTKNDQKACSVKRLFFYTRREDKENILGACQFCYSVKIDDKKIYNLIQDKKRLINRYNSIDELLRAIKKLNYKGILYNVGFNVVNLFYDVSVKLEA